jgi:alpha-1,3-glucosyltransferase
MDEGAHAVTHKQDDDRTDASATHSHVSPQQQQQQQHGGDKVPFWSLALVCLFALLLRYGVSGGGYSGRGGASVEGGSPLHGDFEAQRHWMEITLNLPVAEWYEGTHPANDLQYWGLDYPPLTAYVSYVCGWVARYVAGVPELVELQTSRGHESVQGKLFMRLSVLLCDALFALPATILALRAINASPSSSSAVPSSSSPARTLAVIFLALIQPSFILIDHGHFQSDLHSKRTLFVEAGPLRGWGRCSFAHGLFV